MSKRKYVAVIPARKGSKGFPFKNRLLFDDTADFIDGKGWFEQVIVSTDDEVVAEKARARGYVVHARPEDLSGDAVSIKRVMQSVIRDFKLSEDTVVWLFYLPVAYKDVSDFLKAKKIMEEGKAASLCSFIPAKSHPLNCWSYDEKTGILKQYIENDVYRRQDLPPAWTHHHYICCFKAGEIGNLNSELVNGKTYLFFLGRGTVAKLIEIDTPEHYEQWKLLANKEVLNHGT